MAQLLLDRTGSTSRFNIMNYYVCQLRPIIVGLSLPTTVGVRYVIGPAIYL